LRGRLATVKQNSFMQQYTRPINIHSLPMFRQR